MINSFVQRAREQIESMNTDLKKYMNKDFLDAAMAASALITIADGTISREEKQKAIRFVQNNDALKVFDPNDVNRLFKSHLDALDPDNPDTDADIGEMTAFNSVEKVRKKPEQARMVLRLAIAIGGSDGDFDESEQKMASRIARGLGLEPSEFDLP